MIDNEKDIFIFYLNNKEIVREIGFKEAHERFKAFVSSGKVKDDDILTVVRNGKLSMRIEYVC